LICAPDPPQAMWAVDVAHLMQACPFAKAISPSPLWDARWRPTQTAAAATSPIVCCAYSMFTIFTVPYPYPFAPITQLMRFSDLLRRHFLRKLVARQRRLTVHLPGDSLPCAGLRSEQSRHLNRLPCRSASRGPDAECLQVPGQ
jgi:hypothetical protein